jgi:hypothetical protein
VKERAPGLQKRKRKSVQRRGGGAASPSPSGARRRGKAKARPPGFVERNASMVVLGVLAATLAMGLIGISANLVVGLFAPSPSTALLEHLLKDMPYLGADRLASGLAPIGEVPEDIRRAIRRASREVGVDAGYLVAVAARESSFDPGARASRSSAVGLYQFTEGTWLRSLKLFGPRHGLAAEAGRIAIDSDGDVSVTDDRARAKLLKLRDDPVLSALMAAELGRDNQARLERLLGRKVTPAETYIAHFLGAGQAAQMIAAADASPHLPGVRLLPAAAAANPGVFRPGGGAAPVGAIVASITAYFEREMPRFARL